MIHEHLGDRIKLQAICQSYILNQILSLIEPTLSVLYQLKLALWHDEIRAASS